MVVESGWLIKVSKSLKNKLKIITRTLFSLDAAGRNVTVLPHDVFIVSYPKSGNTWTRFLIANLVYENQKIGFNNIDEKIPDIYRNMDSDLLKLQSPRILKSHEYLDPRYGKVVYIVRDPRDVLVSYYHHHIKFRKLSEGHQLEEFASRFLSGKVDHYGSWGENVGGWIGARNTRDDFLLLRYEDMLMNTNEALRKIASFLRLEANDDRIQRAVSMGSVESMRRLEQQQSSQWKEARTSRQDKSFVRTAKSGNWEGELTESTVLSIRHKWGGLMDHFGYK